MLAPWQPNSAAILCRQVAARGQRGIRSLASAPDSVCTLANISRWMAAFQGGTVNIPEGGTLAVFKFHPGR